MTTSALDDLTLALRKFAQDRDWEKFHTPKNLAMALMVEAAEIAEHFQWIDANAAAALTDEKRQAVALEIADTLLYLLRLADTLGIDVIKAAQAKMVINLQRYPVAQSLGNSLKYNEL